MFRWLACAWMLFVASASFAQQGTFSVGGQGFGSAGSAPAVPELPPTLMVIGASAVTCLARCVWLRRRRGGSGDE